VQVLVLAGGLGTRMRPRTDHMPKALLPVAGRPFVEWQLELLAAAGVRDIVFSIAYRGGMIREALGDGARWGVTIRYVDEGAERRGTGGAVRLFAGSMLADERFAVLYGDSYLPIDYEAVWAAHADCGRPALMTVLDNADAGDTSNALLTSDGRVRYRKGAGAASGMTYIDYGLSVLPRAVVLDGLPADLVGDLADFYTDLGERGDLAGFEVDRRFYEVGSEQGIAELDEHLRAGAQP
jgi:N-acetyl-alpha-D-muramate 1-phosphate uridylyltransferase